MQNKYMCKIVHKCTKTRDKKAKVWDSFFFWMHRSDKKNTWKDRLFVWMHAYKCVCPEYFFIYACKTLYENLTTINKPFLH